MIFMGGDHLLCLQVRPQEFPQGTLHNLRAVSGSGLLRISVAQECHPVGPVILRRPVPLSHQQVLVAACGGTGARESVSIALWSDQLTEGYAAYLRDAFPEVDFVFYTANNSTDFYRFK